MNFKKIVYTILMIFISVLFFVSCKDYPSEKDLKSKSPEEILDIANEWSRKGFDVTSTLTSRSVIFIFKSGKKIVIPLTKDKMALSIGPYINFTHT